MDELENKILNENKSELDWLIGHAPISLDVIKHILEKA